MFISSTASSALLPRQGAPAACELSPLKLYSTDTMPLPPLSPRDLAWHPVFTFYWLQSLLSRTTVIDPKARWDVNVGYNTREPTFVAVLVAGMVVVVRQANDLPASGWVVLGPFFGFRFLFDLWSALPARPASSDSASPSRRRESRPLARLS